MHKKMTSNMTRKPRMKSTCLDADPLAGINNKVNGASNNVVLNMVCSDDDSAASWNSSGVVIKTSSRNRTITASPYAARARPRAKICPVNSVSNNSVQKAFSHGLNQ